MLFLFILLVFFFVNFNAEQQQDLCHSWFVAQNEQAKLMKWIIQQKLYRKLPNDLKKSHEDFKMGTKTK